MEVRARATHEGRVRPEFAESLDLAESLNRDLESRFKFLRDSACLDQIACSRDALMYQMY